MKNMDSHKVINHIVFMLNLSIQEMLQSEFVGKKGSLRSSGHISKAR